MYTQPLPVSAHQVDYRCYVRVGLPDSVPFSLPNEILPEHYAFVQRVAGELVTDLQNNATRTITRTFLYNLLSRSGFQNPEFKEVLLFLLDFAEAQMYYKRKELFGVLSGCVSETTLIYASKYLLEYSALQTAIDQQNINTAQHNLNRFNSIKTDILQFKRVKGANMSYNYQPNNQYNPHINPNQQYQGQYNPQPQFQPQQAYPTQPIAPAPPPAHYMQNMGQYQGQPQFVQVPPQQWHPVNPGHQYPPMSHNGQPQFQPQQRNFGGYQQPAPNPYNAPVPQGYQPNSNGGFYSQTQHPNNPTPNARVIKTRESFQNEQAIAEQQFDQNNKFAFNPHNPQPQSQPFVSQQMVTAPTLQPQRPVITQQSVTVELGVVEEKPVDEKAAMTQAFKELLFPDPIRRGNILFDSEVTFEEIRIFLGKKIPTLYNYNEYLRYFEFNPETGEVIESFYRYCEDDPVEYIAHETKYVAPNISHAKSADKRVIENWKGLNNAPVGTQSLSEIVEPKKIEIVVADSNDLIGFSEDQVIAMAKAGLTNEQKRKVVGGANLRIVGKVLYPFNVDTDQLNDVERFVGGLRNTNNVKDLLKLLTNSVSMVKLPGEIIASINERMTALTNEALLTGIQETTTIDDFINDYEELLVYLNYDSYVKERFEQLMEEKAATLPGRRGKVLFGDQVIDYSKKHNDVLRGVIGKDSKTLVFIETIEVLILPVGSKDSGVLLPKAGEYGMLTTANPIIKSLIDTSQFEDGGLTRDMVTDKVHIRTLDGFSCYYTKAAFNSNGIVLFKPKK